MSCKSICGPKTRVRSIIQSKVKQYVETLRGDAEFDHYLCGNEGKFEIDILQQKHRDNGMAVVLKGILNNNTRLLLGYDEKDSQIEARKIVDHAIETGTTLLLQDVADSKNPKIVCIVVTYDMFEYDGYNYNHESFNNTINSVTQLITNDNENIPSTTEMFDYLCYKYEHILKDDLTKYEELSKKNGFGICLYGGLGCVDESYQSKGLTTKVWILGLAIAFKLGMKYYYIRSTTPASIYMIQVCAKMYAKYFNTNKIARLRLHWDFDNDEILNKYMSFKYGKNNYKQRMNKYGTLFESISVDFTQINYDFQNSSCYDCFRLLMAPFELGQHMRKRHSKL